jgi:hypothetical protein
VTPACPAPAAQPLPLADLQRFLLESVPLAAIAHSFHVDALADPLIRNDPAFQRYSLIELNELHHQVSALGALLRITMGDPTAWQSLGLNLAGFLQNRMAALTVARSFTPTVLQHPASQVMMQLTQQSNQQIAANWPAMQQTLAVTGAPLPGLLVGPHQH